MKNIRRGYGPHPQEALQIAQKRYNIGRLNLLLVALFSLINVILLVCGSYTYFLFSASLPYFLTDLGMFMCGRYPEEFYEGGYQAYSFVDSSVLFLLVAAAFVAIAFYVVCYLCSKKNKVGWIIAALAFFIIDTGVLFFEYDLASSVIDIVFHIYVIVCFCLGIGAHYKLKKLTAEQAAASVDYPESSYTP
jgi:hypothetical protein